MLMEPINKITNKQKDKALGQLCPVLDPTPSFKDGTAPGWEQNIYVILRNFLLSDWFHFDNFLNFSPFIVGKQP